MNQEEVVADWFLELDLDGKGFITASELKAAMSKAGFPFREEQIDLYLKLADVDRDWEIQYHEFLKTKVKMESLLANDNSEKELGSLFDTLDKDNDGFVDSSVVKITMVALDGNLTMEDVARRMQKFYADGHMINMEVFVKATMNKH